MLTPSSSKPLVAAGVLSLAVMACFLVGPNRRLARAQAGAEQGDVWKTAKFDGASYCMGCHTFPSARDEEGGALDLVLMTEYAIWKTHDKHAQAYAVLEGPRSERMARLMGLPPEALTKEAAGCLNCHAMNYLGKREGQEFKITEGVSCGGCHGPSEKWGAAHTRKEWRTRTPEQKEREGMRDLRDPTVRAEVCVSCHVGNAAEGKVVTHAMFAAGHPPLPPFEIATFSRNEPQHWRDDRDVPYFQKNKDNPEVRRNYHLEGLEFQRTRFALVGSLVALRATMKLVSDRAGLSQELAPSATWPELQLALKDVDEKEANKFRQAVPRYWPEIALAHSDCYACHHELKYPGYRQERGFGYPLASRPLIRVTPGRPLVRTWPLPLPESALIWTNQKKQLDELETHLKALAAACSARPFGNPDSVGKTAEMLAQWCDQRVIELKKAGYSNDSVLRLLRSLCSLFDGSRQPTTTLDYEGARQVASVLQVAYEEWRAQGEGRGKSQNAEIDRVFQELTKDFNLQPYSQRQARLQVIMEDVVKELAGRKQLTGLKEFSEYTQDIGNLKLLRALRKNEFLTALQRDVGPDAFTKQLKKTEVVNKLQKLGDLELEQSLASVAGYDPVRFRAQLASLLKNLPAAAAQKP